jgi:hypothetical protein
MTKTGERRSSRSTRAALRSPGRPPVGLGGTVYERSRATSGALHRPSRVSYAAMRRRVAGHSITGRPQPSGMPTEQRGAPSRRRWRRIRDFDIMYSANQGQVLPVRHARSLQVFATPLVDVTDSTDSTDLTAYTTSDAIVDTPR